MGASQGGKGKFLGGGVLASWFPPPIAIFYSNLDPDSALQDSPLLALRSLIFSLMLGSLSRRHVAIQLREARRLSTSVVVQSQLPNARLELDPSFRDFIKSAKDMRSWKTQADRSVVDTDTTPRVPRELEVYPEDSMTSEDYLSSDELDSIHDTEDKHTRKSPAAQFGSQRHGTIVIPLELQHTITKLISGTWAGEL